MFIFRFFASSILGMVTGAVAGIVLLAVVFVVVLGALAATGGPDPCTPGGGPVTVDAANSLAFQQKWDALSATLDSGAPGSATFNESELSSRGDTFLKEHDVGFKDPRVCIHSGSGEGSATFSLLGVDVKVKVRGTMDLSGRHPKAKIDHMEIGNIPGLITGPAEQIVSRAIDSALDDVDLDHRYTPALSPGQAVVSGTP